MAKQQPKKPAPAPAVEEPAGPPAKWSVHLAAPTPLAENPLVVDASSESEAKRLFLARNGIDGSDHPWTIQPHVEPPAPKDEGEPKPKE